MGPNLQKRLHGGPQLWCLRAYQTTGKKKGAFSDNIYDNWILKVEGWFKLMTLEEGELFLTTSWLQTIERQLLLSGEFYNVPVTAEGEDLAANLKKLRVRKNK